MFLLLEGLRTTSQGYDQPGVPEGRRKKKKKTKKRKRKRKRKRRRRRRRMKKKKKKMMMMMMKTRALLLARISTPDLSEVHVWQYF